MNETGRTGLAQAQPSPADLAQAQRPIEALRLATAERHRRLEAMPMQARLLAADYCFAEYREFLQRLYGFYLPLAGALRAVEPSGIWSGRVADRVEALRRDLAELGFTPAELRRVPRCAALPDIRTADEILGCAYVLEGSNLGGRVIHKHLSTVFAGEPLLPLRFFAGDGNRTGPLWRAFCATVDAQAENLDDLCGAACRTFEAVHAWLEARTPAVVASVPS